MKKLNDRDVLSLYISLFRFDSKEELLKDIDNA